jgi:hypothetical protein
MWQSSIHSTKNYKQSKKGKVHQQINEPIANISIVKEDMSHEPFRQEGGGGDSSLNKER